jgi:hypothetical protein
MDMATLGLVENAMRNGKQGARRDPDSTGKRTNDP